MGKSNGKVAWGLGCLIEVIVMFLVIPVLSINQGASLILYMMIMTLFVAGIRRFAFTDGTPYLLRMFIGPIGMAASLAAAVLSRLTCRRPLTKPTAR